MDTPGVIGDENFTVITPVRRSIALHHSYRATYMHSADYAVARCVSDCPSVRHTPVLCLNVTHILKIFSPTGSPTILVFPH